MAFLQHAGMAGTWKSTKAIPQTIAQPPPDCSLIPKSSYFSSKIENFIDPDFGLIGGSAEVTVYL